MKINRLRKILLRLFCRFLTGSTFWDFREYDVVFNYYSGHFFTPFIFTKKTKILFDGNPIVEHYAAKLKQILNIELPKFIHNILKRALPEKHSLTIQPSVNYAKRQANKPRKCLDISDAPFFAWNHQNVKLKRFKESSEVFTITMLNRYATYKRIEMGIEAIRNIKTIFLLIILRFPYWPFEINEYGR